MSASAGRRGRRGGAGTSGGINFQARTATYFACLILGESDASPLWGWDQDTTLEHVHAETGNAADDLLVVNSASERAYVQAKLTLNLSTAEDSEFAKTVYQFVRQYREKGSGARDFSQGDRLVLLLGPEASGKLRRDLPRVLRKLAILSPGADIDDAANTNVEEKVLSAFLGHARRAWLEVAGEAPTDAELVKLAEATRVTVIDLSEEGAGTRSARELLRRSVLVDPTMAGSSWDSLESYAAIFGESQTGAGRAELIRRLVGRGIALRATPSYRGDIERLREYSRRQLARLLPSARIVLVDGTEVRLKRPVASVLSQALSDESLLLVGEPGVGKSGLLVGEGEQRIAGGQEIVVLLAEGLTVRNATELRAELMLEHGVPEILQNWPAGGRGVLLVDGLDQARGEGSQAVLLELLAQAIVDAPDWNVLASIRRFDLRYNRRLREAFTISASSPLPSGYRVAEFDPARHLLVPPLTDPELEQLLDAAPELAQALKAASPALRDLVRVAFNLRLLAELLAGKVPHSQLEPITTQLQLLDRYWQLRISEPDGPRAAVLREVVKAMLEARAMQISRSAVETIANSDVLRELLSDGILLELEQGGAVETEVLTFSHPVLFDYAIERLLLRGEPGSAARALATDPDLVLLAAPSFDLHARHLWEVGPGRKPFWDLAGELTDDPDVPEIAKVITPAAAARLVSGEKDLGPLLAELRSSQAQLGARAEKVLRHFVAAVVGDEPLPFTEDPSRHAVAASLADALVEGNADERGLGSTVDLVRALAPLSDNLTPADRSKLGRAARSLLTFALGLEHSPRALVRSAIEGIAVTYVSEPEASGAALRALIEPRRLERFGYVEMPDLCDQVETLIAVDPQLVHDIYVAVFEFEEESGDSTQILDSGILPLASNKSQDYRAARYSLGQAFPAFFKTSPEAAIDALASALIAFAGRRSSGPGFDREITIEWEGLTVTILGDGSQYWDSGTYAHEDEFAMLSAFDTEMEKLASESGPEIGELVDRCKRRRLPAAIWRRILGTAALHPQALAPLLVPLLRSSDALSSRELGDLIRPLLPVALPHLPIEERKRIESAVIGLPETYARLFPEAAEARELGELRRDEFLSNVGPDGLTSESARVLADSLQRDDPLAALTEAGLQSAGWASSTGPHRQAEQPLPKGPGTTTETAAEELRTFEEAHHNDPPDAGQATSVEQPLRDLWRSVEDGLSEVGKEELESLRALAADVAGTVASAPPAGLAPSLMSLVEEILVACASHRLPEPNAESDRRFSEHLSWDGGTPRIGAARGLMLLAVSRERLERSHRECIEKLSRDPVASVRFHVVRRLGMLRLGDPDLMNEIADRIAREDPSSAVKAALVTVLPQVTAGDTRRMGEVAEALLQATPIAKESEELRERSVGLLTDLYIWHDDQAALHFLNDFVLSDLPARLDEATRLVHRLRDPFVHGDADPSHKRLRLRAVQLAELVIERAGGIFRVSLAAVEAKPENLDEEDEGRLALKAAALLLDRLTSEIYFASGVFQEKQGESTIDKSKRERLYREAGALLDRLAEIPLPRISHHLVETLEACVEFDPRGVLLRIARVVELGKAGNYQLESLAQGVVVRLIERYLAEYRSLFQRDAEARKALIGILDAFVAAGWPDARRLTYGLPEIFR